MWWLTGPQSLCQMFIRNLSLRFSLRPQPCLSAYKCAALLSQQPTQQHSLLFAQALRSELKCFFCFPKGQLAVLFLFRCQTMLLDILQIYIFQSITLSNSSGDIQFRSPSNILYVSKSITVCSWFQAIDTLLPPSLFLSLSVKNEKPPLLLPNAY